MAAASRPAAGSASVLRWRLSGAKLQRLSRASGDVFGSGSTESAGAARALSTATTAVRAAAHTITMENMNPCVKTMEYAVRGPLVIRATEIENELKKVSLSSALFFVARIGSRFDCNQKNVNNVRFLNRE